jgi:hypothetical protein
MRYACLLVVAACTKATPPPKPLPQGPYVVSYNCFHSDEPFGKGSQYRNLSIDLGALTVTTQNYEVTGTELDRPPQPGVDPRKPPAPTVAKLEASAAGRLRPLVEAVLRGGPYKEELPVPEGAPCTLAITAGGRQVFTIEKAYTNEPDAVTALVKAL